MLCDNFVTHCSFLSASLYFGKNMRFYWPRAAISMTVSRNENDKRFLIRSMKRRRRYPSNQGIGRLCQPSVQRMGL